MTIPELVQMCELKLVGLSQLRESALRAGDIDQANYAETETLATQTTLTELKTLLP